MITRARKGREQVTIVRALSKLGVASRSEALAWIRQGRVRVNGYLVHVPHLWLDPRHDLIAVDGAAIRAAAPAYLAMHKPAGIVTTRKDERGRNTVMHLLPAGGPRVFPVGRLDKDTAGLLLFTNDVRLGDALTDPSHRVPKSYCVLLAETPRSDQIERWESGMTLRDGTVLRPALVEQDHRDPCRLVLTITEGKNRQIRRMMQECGCIVRALTRLSIGPIALAKLPPGQVRFLTPDEVRELQDAAGVPRVQKRRHS